MDKKRAFTIVTIVCVLISTTFFILGCVAIWNNEDYAGGNHSSMFGTRTEKVLMKYSIAIPLLAAIPLVVPIVLRRNVMTIILSVCSVALYFFLQVLLITLTD